MNIQTISHWGMHSVPTLEELAKAAHDSFWGSLTKASHIEYEDRHPEFKRAWEAAVEAIINYRMEGDEQ
jgi:hypothetical protein